MRVRLPPRRWGHSGHSQHPPGVQGKGPSRGGPQRHQEEAEEGPGAIVAPWTEPLAQLVPAPPFLSNIGGVFKGLTQTRAQELLEFWKAGLHFLQPLPFRNGSTVLERGRRLPRRVADRGALTGATAAGGGRYACIQSWPQDSSPAFEEQGGSGPGKSPRCGALLRPDPWYLAVALTDSAGTHEAGPGAGASPGGRAESSCLTRVPRGSTPSSCRMEKICLLRDDSGPGFWGSDARGGRRGFNHPCDQRALLGGTTRYGCPSFRRAPTCRHEAPSRVRSEGRDTRSEHPQLHSD